MEINDVRWTRKHTKKTIFVIHHTVTSESKPVIKQFKNKQRKSSYHYLVEDDFVYQFVDTKFIAHHAGDWGVNEKSVGIALIGGTEDLPKPSQKSHDTTAELIAKEAPKWDINYLERGKNVFGHGSDNIDSSPTECPGETDVDYIVEKANEFLMGEEDMSLEDYMKEVAQAYVGVFNVPPTHTYMKFEAKKLAKGEVSIKRLRRLWREKDKDYEKHFANLWQYVMNHGGLRDKYDVDDQKSLNKAVEHNFNDIIAHYIEHGIEEGVTDHMDF